MALPHQTIAGLLVGQVLRAGAPTGVRQQAQPLQAPQAPLRPRHVVDIYVDVYIYNVYLHLCLYCVVLRQQQAPPPLLT